MRVAVQALAAVLGGTQSLHTNGRDEALALPTEDSARIALRTQQIIAARDRASPTPSTRSPASWHDRAADRTRSKRARATLLERIEAIGGTLAAIEAGVHPAPDSGLGLQGAAGRRQPATSVVVGVNRYQTDERPRVEVFALDPDDRAAAGRAACEASAPSRDQAAWRAALDAVESAARGRDNLVPPIIAAVEARATVGEIADTLRGVFGEFREVAVD